MPSTPPLLDGPTTTAPPPIDFVNTPTSEPTELSPPLEVTNELPPDQRPPTNSGARASAHEPSLVVDAAGSAQTGDQSWLIGSRSPSRTDSTASAYAAIAGNPIRESIAGFVRNKRNLAIVGGATLLLIVIIAFATGGDSKPSNAAEQNTKVAVETPREDERGSSEAQETAPTNEAGSDTGASDPTGTDTAAGASATGTTTANESATEASPTGASTSAAATTDASATSKAPSAPKKAIAKVAPKKKTGTLAGKQVVVETDTQAREGKPVANAAQSDQAAISRARAAYTAGNSRLFAGDPDGAIRHYKQALAYYPAYVAGYRGLGLAYAQKRDNANAVKALRTYVNAAPTAKDAALIRKRIQALSAR